ncbi:NAD(P)/FAD-dependent oxidoreductase [Ochrobactrum vermis]|uniref:NAD(P)/FAD-dependent oxidoreductase n=1 Tax=Ochrobactrum vermis TaxID=1827297 RepID=UPI000CFC53C8|nr:FAD-binding oxidoreductase [Ochrobactrum vermis]PQZ25426.1 FAD-dependent oxidoreductase [Ochrobactrum vermis]
MREFALSRSLWRETSTPPLNCNTLEEDIAADVVIIGGGYTGLSAAITAIERGLKPVVLEAEEVGFGASGRNGGVVSTKYRVSLSTMAQAHGKEVAQRMNTLGHAAMDCVENYVERFQIRNANLSKTGNIRCAHNKAAFAMLVEEANTTRGVFGDTSITVLNANEVASETGSTRFFGGVLNSHAGIIHPLNYCRGLANAVLVGGGLIYENSPALRMIEEGSERRIYTKDGSVRCKQLLIATNAYSDITSVTNDVRKTIIPFRSAIISTEALPASVFDDILCNNRSYSETRRMMRWFRRSGDSILFGGRGAFGKNDSAAAYSTLAKAMYDTFPQLNGYRVTNRWSGLVAMTMDSLPQTGLINKDVAFSLGYNGTGIAMSSLLGRYAIDLLQGEKPDLALMQRQKPEGIPFFSMRAPAVRTVAAWYQLLDKIGR